MAFRSLRQNKFLWFPHLASQTCQKLKLNLRHFALLRQSSKVFPALCGIPTEVCPWKAPPRNECLSACYTEPETVANGWYVPRVRSFLASYTCTPRNCHVSFIVQSKPLSAFHFSQFCQSKLSSFELEWRLFWGKCNVFRWQAISLAVTKAKEFDDLPTSLRKKSFHKI